MLWFKKLRRVFYVRFFKKNNYLIRELCSIYISIAGGFTIIFGYFIFLFGSAISTMSVSRLKIANTFDLGHKKLESLGILSNTNPSYLYAIFTLFSIFVVIFGILELIWGLKSYNAKYNPKEIFTRAVIIFLANVSYLIFYQRQILTVITAIVVTIFLILSYYYKIGEIPIIEQEKNGYYIPKD